MLSFKYYLIIFFCFLLFVGYTQNQDSKDEVIFAKEIIVQDTCYRFYNVTKFNKKSKKDWFSVMEYIHNIVLILPSDDEWDKAENEIKTSCENTIFYCMDNFYDLSLITIENLQTNIEFRRKIICKFNFNNGRLEVDPFNLKIYRY